MGRRLYQLARRNAFIRGFVRVLDFASTPDREEILMEIRSRSDRQKLGHDWEKVGRDIRVAMSKYREEHHHVFQG